MFWRRSEIATDVTQTGGGRVWRAVVGSGLVIGLSFFLASVIQSPSKRNIEALAGLIFGGILLIAAPMSAYLFTICLLPFPAHTSVASTSMMLIMALAAMIVIRAKVERFGSPFVSRGQDLALMGWVVMIILSFYNQDAEMYLTARYLFIGFVTGVILYYVSISLLNTEERLLLALRASQVVAILLALIGVMQWVFPDKIILPEFFSFSQRMAERESVQRGEVRVMATFNGQESFAEYVAMSVLLQYFLMRWARSLREKSFWIIGMLILLAGLFATATRGGLIILVGGFLYLIAFGSSVVPRVQSGRVIFVAIAAFYLALGVIEPLVTHMIERVMSIGVQDSSVQSRSIVLTQAIDAIVSQPFLGHGISTAPGTFRGGVSIHIHNLYLTLAYTIGIPGVLAFTWFVVGLWRKTREVFQDNSLPQRTREIGLALHIILVMFLVDQIKIEFTRQPMTMHLAWLHFGFMMAIWSISRRMVAARGVGAS